jgi:DnaJ family protein A protein 2
MARRARAQVSMRPIKDMEEELRARRQYAKAHSAEAYESSDEEDGMPRGQKVQCAQQ